MSAEKRPFAFIACAVVIFSSCVFVMNAISDTAKNTAVDRNTNIRWDTHNT